jgi:hypothetical protein
MYYLPRITSVLSWPSLIILLMHAFDDEGQPTELLVGASWFQLAKIEDGRFFVGPGLCEYLTLAHSRVTIWDEVKFRYKGLRTLVKDA